MWESALFYLHTSMCAHRDICTALWGAVFYCTCIVTLCHNWTYDSSRGVLPQTLQWHQFGFSVKWTSDVHLGFPCFGHPVPNFLNKRKIIFLEERGHFPRANNFSYLHFYKINYFHCPIWCLYLLMHILSHTRFSILSTWSLIQ